MKVIACTDLVEYSVVWLNRAATNALDETPPNGSENTIMISTDPTPTEMLVETRRQQLAGRGRLAGRHDELAGGVDRVD